MKKKKRLPFLKLAYKSLRNRKATSLLTIGSITLSVTLLLGVEKIRLGAREGFSNTISQTDLIVGARGGTIQLLLYAVFRIGNATNNISFKTYEHFKSHQAVAWTIPYSLGDSHKGYRVVATDKNFYEHYRFMYDHKVELRQGNIPSGLFDVALGAEVADKLGYKISDPIVIAHGVTDGVSFMNHTDKPFAVTGILQRTGTPIDRSIYITLEGMEAIHIDWTDGAPPMAGQGISADELKKRRIEIGQITAFLLRTKSRIETLRLQREIDDYEDEALSAIIPGVALNELWTNIGYAEVGLRAVSAFVVVVGLSAMLIALYASLNERRREMAIFRALGAGPRLIATFLVVEAVVLTVVGAGLGIMITYGLVLALQPVIQDFLGLYIPISGLSKTEIISLSALLLGGFIVGLFPAMKAYRNSLVDGLAVRT